MSLEFIKNIMNNLDNAQEEPEENTEQEEIKRSDIYDVLKILDRYKKEDAIHKIYKAKLDYHRDGNSICLIITFSNLRKADRLNNLFSSEFIQNLFNELSSLNISNNLKRKIQDKRNYKLELFGDTGIYKTPYYRV